MDKILIALLIGTLKVTSYRSVKAQTDDSPYYTSIGERCNVHGCAVSRDLLKRWGGPLNYGDVLIIDNYNVRIINDVMGPKEKHSVDLWVQTRDEEKKVGVRHEKVWVLKLN